MIHEIPGKQGWHDDGLLGDVVIDRASVVPDPQSRIHEWAELTFGSATHLKPLYTRTYSEFLELADEVNILGPEATIDGVKMNPKAMNILKGECADVAITLFRFAGALGFDLLEEVHTKQSINERRKWRRHGDGTGQHIKNTEV